MITGLIPDAHEVVFADGSAMAYDLFLGVPKHVVPAVVAESGLTVDGWVPVDPLTLQTQYPNVYAIGDVTSVGTPKAGVFSEGQAAVVTDAITARINSESTALTYGGNGVCYVELASVASPGWMSPSPEASRHTEISTRPLRRTSPEG